MTLPPFSGLARGLVLHYRADKPVGPRIPEDRLAEIDSRYAETMLHAWSSSTGGR